MLDFRRVVAAATRPRRVPPPGATRPTDFIRCLRAIWNEGVVDYDGRFYRVPPSEIEPKPVQRPHPPILLRGTTDPALRRAGRVADGWISGSRAALGTTPDSIATLPAAAEEAGRDPDGLRFVCRGVVKVRADERGPLVGTLDDIRADLENLAAGD